MPMILLADGANLLHWPNPDQPAIADGLAQPWRLCGGGERFPAIVTEQPATPTGIQVSRRLAQHRPRLSAGLRLPVFPKIPATNGYHFETTGASNHKNNQRLIGEDHLP